jgi:outer membrane protein assembly factor BamB
MKNSGMRLIRFLMFVFLTASLFSCEERSFVGEVYKKGDGWIHEFSHNNSLPGKVFADDRIYCSSYRISPDTGSNYLYCLNLKTGEVDWVSPVASPPGADPIVLDSFIYYCGYLGDIYKFDKNGYLRWERKLDASYSDHMLNPINKNLLVKTVVSGLREYDFETGATADSIRPARFKSAFPVFKHDTIFHTKGDSLFSYKYATFDTLWRKKIGPDITQFFIDKDELFYFTPLGTVSCMNVNTGELIWESQQISDRRFSLVGTMKFWNGKLFIHESGQSNLKILDRSNGKMIRKITYTEEEANDPKLDHVLATYVVSRKGIEYDVRVVRDFWSGQIDLFAEKRWRSFGDTSAVLPEQQ